MNKVFTLALAAALAFGPVAGVAGMSASAQEMNLETNPNDPVTGFAPAKWLKLALKMIEPSSLVGKPMVLAINATPEPLTVKCGGYVIVGAQPYKSVVGNPTQLMPFKVTPIRTEEFNTYCSKKGSLIGTSMNGTVLGWMNAESFNDSTIVVFSAANNQ